MVERLLTAIALEKVFPTHRPVTKIILRPDPPYWAADLVVDVVSSELVSGIFPISQGKNRDISQFSNILG